jgi:hypothetical protein
MKVLLDYRGSDWTGLAVSEIKQRAARVKEMAAEIGRQQIAHVARVPASYQAARLVGLSLDRQVPFQTRLFTSLGARARVVTSTDGVAPACRTRDGSANPLTPR